jgi:hypothetical protein
MYKNKSIDKITKADTKSRNEKEKNQEADGGKVGGRAARAGGKEENDRNRCS